MCLVRRTRGWITRGVYRRDATVYGRAGCDAIGPPSPPRETSAPVRAFPAAGQRRGGVRSLRLGGGGAPERPTRRAAALRRADVLGAHRARCLDRARAGHVPAVPAQAARRSHRRQRDDDDERGGRCARETRVFDVQTRRRPERTERAVVACSVQDRTRPRSSGPRENLRPVRFVRPR